MTKTERTLFNLIAEMEKTQGKAAEHAEAYYKLLRFKEKTLHERMEVKNGYGRGNSIASQIRRLKRAGAEILHLEEDQLPSMNGETVAWRVPGCNYYLPRKYAISFLNTGKFPWRRTKAAK